MSIQNNNTADNTVLTREINRVIECCIEKLPEEYRMTFTLRELAGLNAAETAEMMNTTASHVKVRLQRAKRMLRREIEKNYTATDIYEFNLIYCDKIVNQVMEKIASLKNSDPFK